MPAAVRDELWRQALDAVDQFSKQFPTAGLLVQVRAQRGLVELAWGELLAQEAETTGNAEQLSAARDHLRKAIEELRRRRQIERDATPVATRAKIGRR